MPRSWRRAAAPLAAVLAAAALWAAVAASTERLPVAAPLLVTRAYVYRSDTLRRNETLTHVLRRHDLNGRELQAVLAAAEDLDPRRLRAGQVVEFRYVLNQTVPDRVRMRLGDERVLTVERDSALSWRSRSTAIEWSVEVRRIQGEVRSSLYETIDALIPDSVLNAGQRAELVWDLADGVFGWVIDFTRDNYPGDRFALLYERLLSNLGDARYGRILAARVETRGQVNTAYALTDARGRNAYFDAEGHSLKRAFKLYPAEFRRISSGFARRRFHPILKRNRPHLGVDYAAAIGTPIYATGDGTVVRAGRWGGYGVMVAIRHPKGIETRYAHMRRVAAGIRPGVRVRQGQRIGEVGMTGLATAPHVHYEFIKNGRHMDPRTAVRYGDGEPVPADRRAEFEAVRARYDRLLALNRSAALAAGMN